MAESAPATNTENDDSKLFVLKSIPEWATEEPETSDKNPSHKTATTSLKEYCDKKRLNPKFDLISSTGGEFVYQAKLGDDIFTAKGSSKKNARNKCSEKMLLALKDQMADEDKIRYLKPYFGDDQIGSIQPKVAESFIDKNPIGELQEYAVALQWLCPTYDVVDETGPAHYKSFVMQCNLNKLTAVGTEYFQFHKLTACKVYWKVAPSVGENFPYVRFLVTSVAH